MNEITIDFGKTVRMLKKRSSFICKVCFLAVVVAVVLSYILPPTYESEVCLRVMQLNDSGHSVRQLMSTHAEIIKSRAVVQSVIDKTNTAGEAPLYEDFVKRIATLPVKDTDLLKIKVEGKTAEEAHLIATTLVETFLGRLNHLAKAQHTATREFIGDRLQQSKQELDTLEAQLESYKRNTKIVSPSEQAKSIVEKLSTLKKIESDNATGMAMAQARLAAYERQLAQEKPGFVADNPLIQQYKARLADLEVELVKLTDTHTSNHPKVISLRAAVDDVRSKIDQEVSRVAAKEAPSMNPVHQGILQGKVQAEVDLAAGSAQSAAIRGVIRDHEAELAKVPGLEQGLNRLLRDVTVAQELYVMLAKRYEEARINERMQQIDIQVVDSPVVPLRPAKPRVEIYAAVALALGLLLGSVLAVYLEHCNLTIQASEDAQRYLGLPVLGMIPDDGGMPRKKTGDPGSPKSVRLGQPPPAPGFTT